jgi:prophage regulatory protein
MQPRTHNAMQSSIVDSMPPTFLRMPMVLRMTGLGRSTIYRLIAKNMFPVPVRLGDRAVAWRRTDLDRWSDGRLPSNH